MSQKFSVTTLLLVAVLLFAGCDRQSVDTEIERLEGKHPWPPVGSPSQTHDSGYSSKGSDE